MLKPLFLTTVFLFGVYTGFTYAERVRAEPIPQKDKPHVQPDQDPQARATC